MSSGFSLSTGKQKGKKSLPFRPPFSPASRPGQNTARPWPSAPDPPLQPILQHQGEYDLQVHPNLLAAIDQRHEAEDAVAKAIVARRRRTFAMMTVMYILTWSTCIFLPQWANTPYRTSARRSARCRARRTISAYICRSHLLVNPIAVFTTATALANLWIENVLLPDVPDRDIELVC